jgi:putative transposase
MLSAERFLHTSAIYTCIAFIERCREMNVIVSIGAVGDAYDNAMAESFFATLV